MASYYENSFTHDLGQEFADPIGFNDMSTVTPDIIISNMSEICKEHDIPVVFRESSIEISKGVFNKHEFKAVEISHPNPPQRYCDQLYVILGDCVRFFFVGSSEAFATVNNYQAAMDGTGGNLKAKLHAIAGIEPDMEPYETEMEWHQTIFAVFQSLLE